MFLQQLVTGISVGGIYALLATGYSLIYSLLDFSNWAHGEFAMVSAYVAIVLSNIMGMPFVLAAIGGMMGGSDALTPDGNLTLIDDIGFSTKAGKQFITLESKNGNVFYMIIDRDDEGEETVHFLNQVDEADLMALTGEEETPAVCSCTTKCVAGAVNTSCPVCAVNMTECVGKEAKPEVPAEPTEPAAEEPEKKNGVGGILVVLLIVALGGGAAFYIFKQKKAKPQTKGSADLDDYDYGEDEDEYEFEPYEDEPEQDTTEDTDA